MGDTAQPFKGIGAAIAHYRAAFGLTQAELAELVSAIGSGQAGSSGGHSMTRQQVMHLEAGRRGATFDDVLYIAHVLRQPLWRLIVETAGYEYGLVQTASVPLGDGSKARPVYTPAAVRAASGGAAAHMRGDLGALQAVSALMDSWRDYETRSGRAPTAKAERAKRAALWKDYERDPAGFIARATQGAAQ